MLIAKSKLTLSVAVLCSSVNIFFSAVVLVAATAPATAVAATSSKCPGESGYYYTNNRNSRNPRKGGFVSDSANVGDHVFIAPTAAVCNSASVLEYARVYGNAIISGEAEVTDKARVFGNAQVLGTALIAGKAKVSDHAVVNGDAIVEGVAWIRGYYHAKSGHITQGTKRAAKPQSLIKAERKQAAREKARIARERELRKAEASRKKEQKRKQCMSDWYAKEKRLKRENDEARDACHSRNCTQYWDKAWGRKLKDAWYQAGDRLREHKKTSAITSCL